MVQIATNPETHLLYLFKMPKVTHRYNVPLLFIYSGTEPPFLTCAVLSVRFIFAHDSFVTAPALGALGVPAPLPVFALDESKKPNDFK